MHGRFRLDRKARTQRIIRAIENPFTTVLGHMTGRQLLRRPGYQVDSRPILAASAAHVVAVEINANPWRLDLDWRTPRFHEVTAIRGPFDIPSIPKTPPAGSARRRKWPT